MKTFFSFPSRDGKHDVKAIKWQNEEIAPKAILQLIHGFAEFVDRYDEFATYFANLGYIVVGDDHLGHGETAESTNELGYFCHKHADSVLVRDEHRLKKLIQQKHPQLPYFILGHSFGSLILRNYLIHYGSGIDGAIICGTCHYKKAPLLGGTIVLIMQNKMIKKKKNKKKIKKKDVATVYRVMAQFY